MNDVIRSTLPFRADPVGGVRENWQLVGWHATGTSLNEKTLREEEEGVGTARRLKKGKEPRSRGCCGGLGQDLGIEIEKCALHRLFSNVDPPPA
ncbi:hypothetical protein PG990_004851 [Apiospora arundinis]